MKKLISIVGLLAVSAAGAATLSPITQLNPTGSSSGQAIVSTGPTTAPAWGNVTAAVLAPQAANTVVANATGSPASPTAVAMPSCSSSTSALQWTSSTGFTCFSGSAPLASPAFTGAPTITNSAASGNTLTVSATSNTAFGSSILFQGNGATTPNKTIRVLSGILGIVNSSNSLTILTVDDSGNIGALGGISVGSIGSGQVGESPAVTNLSGVSLTSGVAANVSSASLTAGTWDVSCVANFSPGAGTTISEVSAGISTTSATFGGPGTYNSTFATLTTGAAQTRETPIVPLTLASTTTVYCIARSTFGINTMTAAGFLRQRRIK